MFLPKLWGRHKALQTVVGQENSNIHLEKQFYLVKMNIQIPYGPAFLFPDIDARETFAKGTGEKQKNTYRGIFVMKKKREQHPN